jgi:hypothetical protein
MNHKILNLPPFGICRSAISYAIRSTNTLIFQMKTKICYALQQTLNYRAKWKEIQKVKFMSGAAIVITRPGRQTT